MLTGTTDTTHTFYGRPYMVYLIEHLNHTQQLHHIQQQYNKHIQTCCELFHQTVHKHCQTRNIQGYNITLTTSQVQEAIKQSKNNNSQGLDKLNTRPLKHISPLGLAFLTSMFQTALNKNTSHIPNTAMQHGYKTQHSTVTVLHILNNTVAKGFNQIPPPARTITVALDMSKAFDTINIHTLIRRLLQTNLPGTIIKFIANYIKGCKAYTTYINHTSRQRQFKTGVPQGGVLSPPLFNIYT